MIKRSVVDIIRMDTLQAMLRHVPTDAKYRKPTMDDARFIVSLPATAEIEEREANRAHT